jgi:hypothetical protein
MNYIKLLLVSEAHIMKEYKNLKRRVLKLNKNMYFNQLCLKKKMTSTYAKITSQITLPWYKIYPTERVRDEIKFLYRVFFFSYLTDKHRPDALLSFY